jgi:hypothetical protein
MQKKAPPALSNRRRWLTNLLSLGFLFISCPLAKAERQRIAFSQGAVFHPAVSRLRTLFCKLRLKTEHFLQLFNPDIPEFQF